MSAWAGCGTVPSAVVSSVDEPPGRSDLDGRRTPQLQVRATAVPAEAGRGRQSGSLQVKPTILTLPRPWEENTPAAGPSHSGSCRGWARAPVRITAGQAHDSDFASALASTPS